MPFLGMEVILKMGWAEYRILGETGRAREGGKEGKRGVIARMADWLFVPYGIG